MPKVLFCANCGAEIADEHAAKCAYCGYIIERGAEEKYMRHLEDIQSAMDTVDEQEATQYKVDIRKNLKKVLITLGILLVLAGTFVAIGMSLDRGLGDNSTVEEQKAEMVWQNMYYAKLDEAYEAGDYELLRELMRAEETEGHKMYSWSHFGFYAKYDAYSFLKEDFEGLGDIHDLGKSNIEFYFYDLAEFYYRDYADYPDISQEETLILDGFREEIIPILYERYNFTDSDMERFLEEYGTGASKVLALKDCKKIVNKYYDNFN